MTASTVADRDFTALTIRDARGSTLNIERTADGHLSAWIAPPGGNDGPSVGISDSDRERITTFLASPTTATAGEQQYLIWSHHHDMWWGPDSRGYRSQITDAGRYTLTAARAEMRRDCYCCQVPEVPVPAPPPGLDSATVVKLIAVATEAEIAAGRINRYFTTVAASGCDDCSAEPGERHGHSNCPGHLRAVARGVQAR